IRDFHVTGVQTCALPILASAPTTHTLQIENSTGVLLDDQNADRYAFTISGVTNPTDPGTFYARIITYTSDTGDIDNYAPGTEGEIGRASCRERGETYAGD